MSWCDNDHARTVIQRKVIIKCCSFFRFDKLPLANPLRLVDSDCEHFDCVCALCAHNEWIAENPIVRVCGTADVIARLRHEYSFRSSDESEMRIFDFAFNLTRTEHVRSSHKNHTTQRYSSLCDTFDNSWSSWTIFWDEYVYRRERGRVPC